ncbi:hypothetical protein GGR50DRAFT_684881 [Xylaria sp. CBS 124048]|nr:hypothetical protein GGR50DRAFT_684881 [Xylaria sp. CBS 124048]
MLACPAHAGFFFIKAVLAAGAAENIRELLTPASLLPSFLTKSGWLAVLRCVYMRGRPAEGGMDGWGRLNILPSTSSAGNQARVA